MSLPDAPGVTYIVDGPAKSGILDLYHASHQAHAKQRLALPFFQSVARYQVKDDQDLFITIYNVNSLNGYAQPAHQEINNNPPEEDKKAREAGGLKSDERKIMALEYELASAPDAASKPGAYLVSETATVLKTDIAEVVDWLKSEHFELQSKVPGFRRARAFQPAIPNPDLKDDEADVMILYEYETDNGLGGPVSKAAWETENGSKIRAKFRGGLRREANFIEEIKN